MPVYKNMLVIMSLKTARSKMPTAHFELYISQYVTYYRIRKDIYIRIEF